MKTCKLSDEDLVKKCAEWVDKLCKSGGSSWSLSVPVNFEKDPDVLFSELIKRYSEKYHISTEHDTEFLISEENVIKEKRFHAACCVMQGLLSNPNVAVNTTSTGEIISDSYVYADEILKQGGFTE